MTLDEKFKEIKEELSEIISVAAKDGLEKSYGELLPHISDDTEANVMYRAKAVVKNILAGKFEENDGEYVVVKDGNDISIRLRVTTNQYDSIRKNLISVMPRCPKDLEIESLKEQIKAIQNRGFY